MCLFYQSDQDKDVKINVISKFLMNSWLLERLRFLYRQSYKLVKLISRTQGEGNFISDFVIVENNLKSDTS